MKKVQINIIGMHCTSCAKLSENALTKVDGVLSANVNYAAEKATVTFSESVVSEQKLIDAISKAGYKASITDSGTNAMGSGTDVAMETGGIVIIKNDLRDVVSAIELSRETMSKIKQNMFFALFYNVIGIPIAARLFVGLGLELRPELAGLAMALSSISVVSNSLLLKMFKPNQKNYISAIAPVIMIIVFTLLFIEFARLSRTM